MARHSLTLAILGLSFFPLRVGLAHQSSMTYSTVQARDDGFIDYQLLLSTRDLNEALALGSDREPSPAQIERGRETLFDYVLARLSVSGGGPTCTIERRGLKVMKRPEAFVELGFAARCPAPFVKLVINYDLFFDLDKAHVGRLQVRFRGRTVTRELERGLGRFEWSLAPPVTLDFDLEFFESVETDQVKVFADGPEGPRCPTLADGPGRIKVACPRPYDQLFVVIDLDATGTLRVSDGTKTDLADLPGHPIRFTWRPGDLTPWTMGLWAFVQEGVRHIFGGLDHIAFVVALLLVATVRRERTGLVVRSGRSGVGYVLQTVTAFTVAHSLTLVFAALDVLTLPSRLVEVAIAATIVWVAVENMWLPDGRRRLVLVFGFGLVHGLGFAGALRPMLPPSDVVVPLLAMNLGVELGQIGIVLLLYPVLSSFARRSPKQYQRAVVAGGSALVGLTGAMWLMERLFGLMTISRLLD